MKAHHSKTKQFTATKWQAMHIIKPASSGTTKAGSIRVDSQGRQWQWTAYAPPTRASLFKRRDVIIATLVPR